jgi:hypothetical protein
MNFSNIIAATRNVTGFSFFGANKGNNALATLKDVEDLGNQLNNMFSYRLHDVVISHNAVPGGDLRIAVMAAGATECPHNCGSDCILCDCKTGNPCTGGTNEITGTQRAILVGHNMGVGIYELSVVLPPDYVKKNSNPITKVAFFFEPLTEVLANVTITPTADPSIYILRTFLGGVPSDTVLNNTAVSLKIFFKPVVFP